MPKLTSRLQDFLDYRLFLLDFYRKKCEANPHFSYRLFASKVSMDTSQLHRILNSKLHLPLETIPRLAAYLELDTESTQHFEQLVRLGRAKFPSMNVTRELQGASDFKKAV